MNYTIEDIYCSVGKDDKAASLTFKHGSESFNKYGSFITVLFLYTQDEREYMDNLIQNKPYKNHKKIKAKYLGSDLTPDKIDLLLNEGVFSGDIANILYFNIPINNTFHSREKKTLNTVTIPTIIQPNGRDIDWMYHFIKKLVLSNIGLSPNEREFYLAGKIYYETESLTDEEKKEIYSENGIIESIEFELLQIKYNKGKILDEEKRRLAELYVKRKKMTLIILDKYLKQSGSSLKKLITENIDLATELFTKVMFFKDRRLNILGIHPLYIDVDSYLHIYMRHVDEFKINNHFENKDNFLWKEADIFNVMELIIERVNGEYQKFRNEKPTQRFSKYGSQSIYFQGDYYTFHIESNGRISTFHRNKKEHERK